MKCVLNLLKINSIEIGQYKDFNKIKLNWVKTKRIEGYKITGRPSFCRIGKSNSKFSKLE